MIKLPYLLWRGKYCPIAELELTKSEGKPRKNVNLLTFRADKITCKET